MEMIWIPMKRRLGPKIDIARKDNQHDILGIVKVKDNFPKSLKYLRRKVPGHIKGYLH